MANGERKPRARAGTAAERVLNALAAEFPTLHNEQSLLESAALAAAHGKADKESLTVDEKKAVSRVLKRLIDDGGVRETLWLNGRDRRVNLENAGLVAVSVDIATLRTEAWTRSSGERAAGPLGPGPMLDATKPATQETIMEVIIGESMKWSNKNRRDGRLPLAITNIAIVHGAVDFDILVNVSFVDQDYLVKYAREVIQRIPHVRATQTMLLSSEQGFSKP